jgi:predicted lipoprotein with Yx(FWY)xxD motif
MSPERLPGRRRRRVVAGVIGTLAVFALLAGVAVGASTLTVRSSANSTLGETVLVNPAGRTMYSLGGESAHHLLCKSSECAHVWPPLTVPSRTTRLKAGAGVHGALAMIKRPNGSMQVTLRGKPLYSYSGDRVAGQAAGEGIRSFGGTWHAVTAAPAAQTPSPAPMAPQSTPPYGY